jgi:hypothetical protein
MEEGKGRGIKEGRKGGAVDNGKKWGTEEKWGGIEGGGCIEEEGRRNGRRKKERERREMTNSPTNQLTCFPLITSSSTWCWSAS